MSSDVSLATSADQPTLTSGSSTGFAAKFNPREGKGAIIFESATTRDKDEQHHQPKLTKWKSRIYHDIHDFAPGGQRLQDIPKRVNYDFYRQVDERMSRNSMDLSPEQRARFSDRWLSGDDSSIHFYSRSSDHGDFEQIYKDSQLGNVIGIRGFLSDQLARESNQQQANYAKLKYKYFTIQTDYRRLEAKLTQLDSNYRKCIRKKCNEVDILRTLLKKLKSTKQKTELTSRVETSEQKPSEQEVDRLRNEVRHLKLMFEAERDELNVATSKLRNERSRIQDERDALKMENDNLKNRARILSMEPQHKVVLELQNETKHLKDELEVNQSELNHMKVKYERLGNQLTSMIADQRDLNKERDEDLAKMTTEFCRLQVHRAKLETIIETESRIKAELQNQINQLKRMNDQQVDELNKLKAKLTHERMRTKKEETVEAEMLLKELDRLKGDYSRLTSEKQNATETISALRHKIDQLDEKFRQESSELQSESERRIGKLEQRAAHLESLNHDLSLKLNSANERLQESKLENEASNDKLLTTTGQLELALLGKDETLQKLSKIQHLESHISDLTQKLQQSIRRNGGLNKELSVNSQLIAQQKKQMSEIHQRLQAQQGRFDELKTSRDNEVARLKLELNYEKYNRQMALRGIERELKASLKELETLRSYKRT